MLWLGRKLQESQLQTNPSFQLLSLSNKTADQIHRDRNLNLKQVMTKKRLLTSDDVGWVLGRITSDFLSGELLFSSNLAMLVGSLKTSFSCCIGSFLKFKSFWPPPLPPQELEAVFQNYVKILLSVVYISFLKIA